MLRLVQGRKAVFSLLAMVLPWLSGCESSSFVPPPPPELSALPDTREGTGKAVSLALILPSTANVERDVWLKVARYEAGRKKVLYTEAFAGQGDPPAKQADLIRAEAERGGSVLLVEPDKGSEVVSALKEARKRGVSVLLLGHRPEGLEPASAFPLVTFAAIDKPAKLLVDALINDTKDSGLPAGGHGLIVVAKGGGEANIAAVRAAFKEAGIDHVEVCEIKPIYGEGAKDVKVRFEADPKITMAVGVDSQGLSGAFTAVTEMKEKRAFSVGGCAEVDPVLLGSMMTMCAGMIDRSQSAFGLKAIRQGIRMAKGEKVEESMEVPTPFVNRNREAPPRPTSRPPDLSDAPLKK